MKKYWKSFMLILISVLVVSVFYIQSALATSSYPTYTLEKQSGDEKEINELVISGTYNNFYDSEEFEMTQEGTKFIYDKSVFQQLLNPHMSLEMKQLRADHWSFTRGKMVESINYYQDDFYVAYSNITADRWLEGKGNQYHFNISVLNKETNKKISFNIKTPNSDMYFYVSTTSVQMVGNELKVLTRNLVGDSGQIEYYLYTFDIENEKLKSGELILKTPQANSQNIDLFTLDEGKTKHNNEQAIFYKATLKENEKADEENYDEGEEFLDENEFEYLELLIYNFETGEMITEELPEALYESDFPYLIDGSKIYFTDFEKDSTEIMVYDIDQKQIEQTLKLDILINFMNISDNKLYILGNEKEEDLLIVINVASGETVYEGKIVSKSEQDGVSNTYTTRFHTIEFK